MTSQKFGGYGEKYVRLFALAVLAGAAIGIGGIVFYLWTQIYAESLHGLNLFTGKVERKNPISLIWSLSGWVIGGTWLAAMGVLGSRINGISEKAQSIRGTVPTGR